MALYEENNEVLRRLCKDEFDEHIEPFVQEVAKLFSDKEKLFTAYDEELIKAQLRELKTKLGDAAQGCEKEIYEQFFVYVSNLNYLFSKFDFNVELVNINALLQKLLELNPAIAHKPFNILFDGFERSHQFFDDLKEKCQEDVFDVTAAAQVVTKFDTQLQDELDQLQQKVCEDVGLSQAFNRLGVDVEEFRKLGLVDAKRRWIKLEEELVALAQGDSDEAEQQRLEKLQLHGFVIYCENMRIFENYKSDIVGLSEISSDLAEEMSDKQVLFVDAGAPPSDASAPPSKVEEWMTKKLREFCKLTSESGDAADCQGFAIDLKNLQFLYRSLEGPVEPEKIGELLDALRTTHLNRSDLERYLDSSLGSDCLKQLQGRFASNEDAGKMAQWLADLFEPQKTQGQAQFAATSNLTLASLIENNTYPSKELYQETDISSSDDEMKRSVSIIRKDYAAKVLISDIYELNSSNSAFGRKKRDILANPDDYPLRYVMLPYHYKSHWQVAFFVKDSDGYFKGGNFNPSARNNHCGDFAISFIYRFLAGLEVTNEAPPHSCIDGMEILTDGTHELQANPVLPLTDGKLPECFGITEPLENYVSRERTMLWEIVNDQINRPVSSAVAPPVAAHQVTEVSPSAVAVDKPRTRGRPVSPAHLEPTDLTPMKESDKGAKGSLAPEVLNAQPTGDLPVSPDGHLELGAEKCPAALEESEANLLSRKLRASAVDAGKEARDFYGDTEPNASDGPLSVEIKRIIEAATDGFAKVIKDATSPEELEYLFYAIKCQVEEINIYVNEQLNKPPQESEKDEFLPGSASGPGQRGG